MQNTGSNQRIPENRAHVESTSKILQNEERVILEDSSTEIQQMKSTTKSPRKLVDYTKCRASGRSVSPREARGGSQSKGSPVSPPIKKGDLLVSKKESPVTGMTLEPLLPERPSCCLDKEEDMIEFFLKLPPKSCRRRSSDSLSGNGCPQHSCLLQELKDSFYDHRRLSVSRSKRQLSLSPKMTLESSQSSGHGNMDKTVDDKDAIQDLLANVNEEVLMMTALSRHLSDDSWNSKPRRSRKSSIIKQTVGALSRNHSMGF
jgi:hypothetical protein